MKDRIKKIVKWVKRYLVIMPAWYGLNILVRLLDGLGYIVREIKEVVRELRGK